METTEHIDGPEELEPNRDTAKRKPTKGRKDVASRKRQYILEDGQGRLCNRKDTKYINLRLREQSDPADNPIQDMLEGKL